MPAGTIRMHEAVVHGACAVLYVSVGLTLGGSVFLTGWGDWLLAAGVALAGLTAMLGTREVTTRHLRKLMVWLTTGTFVCAAGQGAFGSGAARIMRALAGDAEVTVWSTMLGFAVFAIALRYDPLRTRHGRASRTTLV